MKYLRLALVSLTLLTALFVSVQPTKAQTFKRALWVDAWNTPLRNWQAVDDLLAYAQRNQVDVLIIQVRTRNSAYYYYGGPKPPVFDALGALLSKKPAGLRVQAWIDGGWDYSDYPPNYGDPNFREYFRRWYIQPLLGYIGLDGIHLDRMRNPTRGNLEGLNCLMSEIAAMVHPKGLKISVAAKPTAWMQQNQDWPSWTRNGWVDEVYPMNYTVNLNTYKTWLDAQIAASWAPVYSGIPNYLWGTPVSDMVAYAQEKGTTGVAFYSYATVKNSALPTP